MKKKIGALFPLQGRESKLVEATNGKAAKEFFYGTLKYRSKGGDLSFIDSRLRSNLPLGEYLIKLEQLYRRQQNFPISSLRVKSLRPAIEPYEKIISFTDYLSLGLGIANQKQKFNCDIIGGFHGLCDNYYKQPKKRRNAIRKKIENALAGLDSMFFVGEQDRLTALKLFNIDEKKTFLFRFGIDTDFWTKEDIEECDHILSVGSDKNRDYETLIEACPHKNLQILTTLDLKKYQNKPNLTIIKGNVHKPQINDVKLRQLYSKAKFVVVPVLDVLQPSGQSVTMQAMSCGKAVILPDFRGLWDKQAFRSGENCILVKPCDKEELSEAIEKLFNNDALRKQIERNARRTCLKEFNLNRMEKDFERLTKFPVF